MGVSIMVGWVMKASQKNLASKFHVVHNVGWVICKQNYKVLSSEKLRVLRWIWFREQCLNLLRRQYHSAVISPHIASYFTIDFASFANFFCELQNKSFIENQHDVYTYCGSSHYNFLSHTSK